MATTAGQQDLWKHSLIKIIAIKEQVFTRLDDKRRGSDDDESLSEPSDTEIEQRANFKKFLN